MERMNPAELNWSSPALHEACARFLNETEVFIWQGPCVVVNGKQIRDFEKQWPLLLPRLAADRYTLGIETELSEDKTEWILVLIRAFRYHDIETRSDVKDPGLAVARAVFALMAQGKENA